MKVVKFLFSLLITVALIYFLDNGWNIKGTPIPPLGKFLDPFHGFWFNIESNERKKNENLSIPGLKGPVTVIYDSLLIPHIFASNSEDIYLAQGYVIATDRLWQMDFLTMAASGRVSEIIAGDAILNYDRNQRRLGMVYGAKQAVQFMEEDPVIKDVVLRYTDGVNLYIQSLRYEDLPLEYKLLDYKPELWTPLKCALLLKNMAQTLNMGDKDIEMTNALKLFGKDMVNLLYPDNEETGDPIVDNPGGWKFSPISLDTVPLAIPDEMKEKAPIKIRKRPAPDPTTGSNNWAVAGSKTATGSPMLCNDPHLQLNLPSIWYVVQLHAPDMNVMGVSLPGAPGVIIGFNDSIAWGMTNAQRDLVDWLQITYQDSTRSKYLLDSTWINTEKVVEEIKIKGKPSFYDTVIYTRWGPITYDRNFHAEDNLKDYAFRWIAHDKSREIMTFYKLNRGKNHADYMQALDHFSSPAQNFVFASVSGDIAMRIQGKFPVRRLNEGKFVLDGTHSFSGWQAFIPNEQNVMQKNPERGFVSSANQYPVDNTYPYFITGTSYEAYRNRRINKVLGEKSGMTPEDMMKLQNDNYNLKAAESLPLFLSYLDTTNFSSAEKSAHHILKSWDFFNQASSTGACYYESLWDHLMPLVWDEMESKDTTLSRPTTYQTIRLMRDRPDLSFFDIQNTSDKEMAPDVVKKAFTLMVEEMEKWKKEHGDTVRWADYKGSFIGHLLPPLKPLSIPVKTGGNHDIVNAHSRTHGPSWRMIVSLEKSGVKAWATYPGGQSGNPGSKFYSNLLKRWEKGEYYPLLFLQEPNMPAGDSHFTITLTPQQ